MQSCWKIIAWTTYYILSVFQHVPTNVKVHSDVTFACAFCFLLSEMATQATGGVNQICICQTKGTEYNI